MTATTLGSSLSLPDSTVAPTLPALTGTAVLLDAVPNSVGMAECLMPLSELLDVDLAFTADHVSVGERRLIEQTDMGVPVVYRALRFEGTQPVVVPEQVELGVDVVLTTPEAAVFDADVFNPRSVIDFDQLVDLTDVLVLGSIESGGDPVVRLVVAESGGEVTAAGSCTGVLQYVAGGLAVEMGRAGSAGTIGLITDWVAAGPEERAEYAAAEAAWTEAATVPDDPGG